MLGVVDVLGSIPGGGVLRVDGELGVQIYHLRVLCNALQCDAAYLLGEIDTPHREAANIMQATGLSREAAERFLHLRTFAYDFEKACGEDDAVAREKQSDADNIVHLLDILLSNAVNQKGNTPKDKNYMQGVYLIDLIYSYLSTVYQHRSYIVDENEVSVSTLHEAKLLEINECLSEIYHSTPKEMKHLQKKTVTIHTA